MSDQFVVYFSSNRLLLKDAQIPVAIFFFFFTVTICVCLQYGNCFMSPFWHLEFWDGF